MISACRKLTCSDNKLIVVKFRENGVFNCALEIYVSYNECSWWEKETLAELCHTW